jgi:MFS family permease
MRYIKHFLNIRLASHQRGFKTSEYIQWFCSPSAPQMLRLTTKSLRFQRSALYAAANGIRECAVPQLALRENVSVRAFSAQATPPSDSKDKAKLGLWDKMFGVESNVAPENFKNRWLMVVPAFATHMAIGSPWAWSIMADVITREKGFVASAASDWTLMESAFPLSVVFLVLGLSASVVGKWQMKVGARHAIAMSAAAFGGGCVMGAAGIQLHSLPLLYAGYGFMAGTGLGLAYTPPVQTLMQWFPDKKGIASGLTIAGFGSGALFFSPAVQYLMKQFAKMPEYLGPANQFTTSLKDGRLFADVNGAMVEVVNAGAAELAKVHYELAEGLYVVGSGSTGAAEALAVMGGAYFAVLMGSAMALRKPHPSFVAPMPVVTPGKNVYVPPVPAREINLDEAMRVPQFYLLGTAFFCLASGGMGMFSVAKPMMSEVFSAALPAVVTSAFAAKFILMLSGGNLGTVCVFFLFFRLVAEM